ncbi:Ig-like domain-containing protein [Nucisporomicrobium flavum]|uniref:Ig-like domain-containing protein n=1 Tax=Nucisporomicrobium flavum TaxID=2785915 RepID=UPI003C30CB59
MTAVVAVLAVGGAPAQADAGQDVTPPVIQDVGIAAGTRVNKTVVLEPVVSDDVAVTEVSLFVNGTFVVSDRSAPWSLRWNSELLHDVPARVEVTAYDAARNSTRSFVDVHADNYGPFLYFPWFWSDSAHQVSTMSFTGVVPIDFRKYGVPADTARIELSVGDTVIGSADADPWTIPWDTSGYAGKVELRARSWDTSGNEGLAVTHAWADHIGPSIDVRFDDTDGYVSAKSSVDVHAKDPAGADQVELLVDGRLIGSSATDDGWARLAWDRAAKNGRSTMTVRAYDSIGNVGTLTRTVTVDNDAPGVTVTPQANAKVRGTIAATVTGVRDATGPASFTASLSCVSTVPRFGAPWTVTIDTRRCRDGKHTLAFDVRDKAGNQTVVKRSITVDNTKPTVKLSSAPRNKSKLRKSTRITASARDTYGVNRVELLVNGKVVAVDRKAGYAFTVNPKKYGRTFTVQLRAYDQAGNAAYSSKRSYRR